MKKSLLFISTLIFSISSFSQILITDPDLDQANPMDCASASLPNFFDSGNPGNYSANENETIVLCPDYAANTSKLSLTFGINSGLLFDVDGSDTVFVYDGPSAAAPLLGAHNSVTDPNGFNHVASFINNPTGCLTVQFVSDGSNEGTGWEASLACVQPAQPIEGHMSGYLNGVNIINPADTGYADLCFGDSILFVAQPSFPYSSDVTGLGYSQNSNNVTYEWEFSDGTVANTDSVWFTPPARQGYIVSLKITDQFPQSNTITSKVRVSTIPSFSGVTIGRDSICLNDTTIIVGAVTNTDTSGVDPTTSSFQLGGTVAGQVYLPDGSGLNHSDTINITGFVPGSNVTSITDLEQLCLNMEHSFLGDLEMTLTCPNGTTINIFNGYNGTGAGQLIPAGFGGSSTYLGHPIDDASGPPGMGEEYCWSSTLATFGDFPTEFGANNFIALTNPPSPSAGNSMNWNGIYLPEQSFTNLIGCPLNGDWSITIRDNQGIDDGYIFEWSILFDPLLNPNNETYVPTIVSGNWLTAATIVNAATLNNPDTFAIVSSTTPGTLDYTFQVTDNFGCTYDTIAQVEFLGLPTVPNDTGICDTSYQIQGVTSLAGGYWHTPTGGPGTITFNPGDSVMNPLVSTSSNGIYNFTFTDIQCNLTDSFKINFIAVPEVQNDVSVCSSEYQIAGTSSYSGGSWTYTGPGTVTFSPNDTVENPSVSVDVQGLYTFTFTDNECGLTNSFNANFIPTPVIPNDITICNDGYQMQNSSSYSGGIWSGTGPGTVTFTPSNTAANPLFSVNQRGRYTITFTDNECQTDTSFEFYYPLLVSASLEDKEFCAGDTATLFANSNVPEATYVWSTGESTPSIVIALADQYNVEVTGLCNTASDTATVTTIDCNIDAQNVITPNGDGKNDYLVFEGIEHFPGSKLEVFNRWGKRIYVNENYNNDWSPTDVSEGTYFYVFTPGGKFEAEILPVSFTILK
ncbi:MAG: gliding motility-associated C-terminal domain-containing protein [Vicingaceae bacterium]